MRLPARSHVRVSNDLRGLRPLLETWIGLLDRYCRANGYEDNPWFYNERATLSTLAGAAWKSDGWTALEEFSTKKWGGKPAVGSVESGSLRRGRCDLYVSHDFSDFALEAKQAWQPIGRVADSFGRVDQALKLANGDARKLNSVEAEWRLAAVFAVPFLPVKMATNKEGKVESAQVTGRVDEWLMALKERDHDALAYFFPLRCEAMISSDQKRLFPGVALTLDICKRANRKFGN